MEYPSDLLCGLLADAINRLKLFTRGSNHSFDAPERIEKPLGCYRADPGKSLQNESLSVPLSFRTVASPAHDIMCDRFELPCSVNDETVLFPQGLVTEEQGFPKRDLSL